MEPDGIFALPDRIEDRIDDIRLCRTVSAELLHSIQSAYQQDSSLRYDCYSNVLALCEKMEDDFFSMEKSLQEIIGILRQAEVETANLLEQSTGEIGLLLEGSWVEME